MKRLLGYAALSLYAASIVAANWLIHHVGTPIPGGMHLIPVGFGQTAPSGALAAGLTFVARNFGQRLLGRKIGFAAILAGAGLSALVSPSLALASGAAFLFSETADMLVYTPLEKRGFGRAVLAAGLTGDVVDSLIFLTLAGIPLAAALPGLLLAKGYIQLAGGLAAFRARGRTLQPASA